MVGQNRNFLAILLLIVTSVLVPAQSKTSPENSKQTDNFVSVDGGFTIALPSKVTRFSPVAPVKGLISGGSKLGWNLPQGAFVFSFTNYIKTPEKPSKIFEELNNDVIKSIKNDGGKLISRKETSFVGNPGLEAKLHFGNGGTAVYRYFFVKNRLYILTTIWKDGESGDAQIKILDSFKLLDENTVPAVQTEDAAPKALPQFPIVPKLKSDAEDENLKGKVKTVTQEIEYLSEESDIKGRYFETITDYNENGNRIKQLTYLLEEPLEISVFGYIDGLRVVDFKMIANIPDLSFLKKNGPKPPKAPDPRYQFSLEYKYADGKINEEKWLKNDGTDWLKVFYTYKENQVEEIAFDEWGKTNRHTTSTLDEQGNKIKEIDLADSNRTYIIKYDSFDEHGNWTKNTESELVIENGKQVSKPLTSHYRTISYYQ